MRHILILLGSALLALADPGSCGSLQVGGGIRVISLEQAYAKYGAVVADSRAIDGYDLSFDTLVDFGPMRAYVGTYHVCNQDTGGWTGPTGFYKTDWRAPLSQSPGSSQTWRLYVWGDPTLPESSPDIQVRFTSFSVEDPAIDLRLTLVGRPEGVTGGPVLGTVYTWPWGYYLDITLPVIRTTNGLEGYVFDLTATVVPEPSSLLALSAGLAGVVGALRRRSAVRPRHERRGEG